MKDFDVIDRKYTTVSPVQAVLALLGMMPIIAITLHLNPALPLWAQRQFKQAVLVAVLCPGGYAALVGMAFPLISAMRGEMSRRALLITLAIFTTLALTLHIPAYASLPDLLTLHPSRPGNTKWMNFIQGISLYATFTGYVTGISIGCLPALLIKRPKASDPAQG